MANSTKKILHIAPTPFFSDRGCHIRIEGEARCLTQLGYTNIICTYHHGRDVNGVTTQRIKPIAAYTQTSAGPSKHKLLADWRLLWLVFDQYRQLKPQALHAHLHEGLLIGFVVKTLFFWRGTPLIADMQGSLVGELQSHGTFEKRPYLKWLVALIEKTSMWCATHIICSNSHSIEKIISGLGVSADKVSLSQDGADRAPNADKKTTQALLEQHQIDANKTLLVYSGALLDAKGLNELKHVILACATARADLHFLIIGYPTQNLSPFLEEHNLREFCTLTGQVDFEKLPSYLSIADIAIDPKKSDAGEGSGKMLNYLAAGLPVVAFDSLNNRAFLPAGTELAKSNEDLSQILLGLIENKAKRTDSAKANLTQFQENYSWDVTRQQLAKVYKQVVEKDSL